MTTVRQTGAAWVAKNYWGVDHFQLSQDDFQAWAKSLLICANGDGRLSPEERDWVIGLGAAWGWDEELLEVLRTYPADEPLEDVISQSEAAARYGGVAIVFCAIAACSADGTLQDGELTAIRQAAARLGVDDATVDEALRIHGEEQRIIQERISLTYSPRAHFLAQS